MNRLSSILTVVTIVSLCACGGGGGGGDSAILSTEELSQLAADNQITQAADQGTVVVDTSQVTTSSVHTSSAEVGQLTVDLYDGTTPVGADPVVDGDIVAFFNVPPGVVEVRVTDGGDVIFSQTLTVTGAGNDFSNVVEVRASRTGDNAVPVANAGPDQNVTTGTQVTLDGSSSSDADGDTLTYSWSFTSKPAGSTATLASATSAHPTFMPEVDGSYVLRLVVNDGSVDSAADTVTVTAAQVGVSSGEWTGTTSDQSAISFTITDSGTGMAEIGIGWATNCSSGNLTTTYTPAISIPEDGTFTLSGGSCPEFSITGTFDSPTTASGSLTLSWVSIPFSCLCSGSAERSWAATGP